MHGTKIEAIVAGLEEHLGLVIIEHGAKYEVVKKSRTNCKHRGTDHCKDCHDPANVTCPEWRYDYSGTTAFVPNKDIKEHLVKCNRSGLVPACVNCNHGSNHVALNGCTEHEGDYCKYIKSDIKCVPIKEDKQHG